MSVRKLPAVLAVLLVLLACKDAGPTDPSPFDCTAPIDAAGRRVVEVNAFVGRDVAGTCAGIGGKPVFVTAPGMLYARATWTDPRARLRIQVFLNSWDNMVVETVPRATAQCVALSLRVIPGDYTVRTCHTLDTGVPISTLGDFSTYTPLHLTIVYP